MADPWDAPEQGPWKSSHRCYSAELEMRLGYWTWHKIEEEGICRQTTWSSGRHGLWVCRGHLLVWGAGIKQ